MEQVESQKFEKEKPNLIKGFEACVKVVVEIESELSKDVDSDGIRILREQIGNALRYLEEKRNSLIEEEREKFEKRVITGFQGLGGFNRYVVRGDGSIGLAQSHSTSSCIKKAQELGVETPEYGF